MTPDMAPFSTAWRRRRQAQVSGCTTSLGTMPNRSMVGSKLGPYLLPVRRFHRLRGTRGGVQNTIRVRAVRPPGRLHATSIRDAATWRITATFKAAGLDPRSGLPLHDSARAAQLVRQALGSLRKRLATWHPDLIAAEVRLGEALMAEGRLNLAEPPLRNAVQGVHSAPFSLLPWQLRRRKLPSEFV